MGAAVPSHRRRPKPDRGTTNLTCNEGPARAGVVYGKRRGTSFELAKDYSSMVWVPTMLPISSEEQMPVLVVLRQHAKSIADAEQRFRADRRAIAGAAWEALKNPHPTSIASVGIGKLYLYSAVKFLQHRFHFFFPNFLSHNIAAKQAEDTGYLHPCRFERRKKDLASPDRAIASIARIVAATADIAAEKGYNIRRSPDILAYCFNGPDLNAWKGKLADKSFPEKLYPQTPVVSWIFSHLRFIEDGVGPKSPGGHHGLMIVKLRM